MPVYAADIGLEPGTVGTLMAVITIGGAALQIPIGRISDDTILYLMSRGCSEQEARTMVVNGFANPVSKELPLEYAVEMNNLIKLEMEGAIG